MGGGGVWEIGWVSVWGGGMSIFLKEIPLNEISEKLKILLKNVRGGQFSKRNPFKWNFRKLQNFAQKSLMEDPILFVIFLQNPDPQREKKISWGQLSNLLGILNP